MKLLGYITATIITMIYAAMLNGWALSLLWAWFIIPTFELPKLSIPAAIGLSMVVAYLTYQVRNNKDEEKEKYWESLVRGGLTTTTKALFALLFGAVVKMWM
jgi:hypothetical protein